MFSLLTRQKFMSWIFARISDLVFPVWMKPTKCHKSPTELRQEDIFDKDEFLVYISSR